MRSVSLCLLIYLFFLAIFFRGTGKDRYKYLIFSATVLGFLLFFRECTVGSDLGTYRSHYLNVGSLPFSNVWTYDDVNAAFYYYCYIINKITGANYQAFIAITALITFIPPMTLIKRESKNTFYSILAYYCLGFYIFQYSGLKQAIAMAILCFAYQCILDSKPKRFVLLVILAASFHLPCIVFLPAYLIVHARDDRWYLLLYPAVAIIVFAFKDSLIDLMASSYSTVVETSARSGGGGKVILILVIAVACHLLIESKERKITYCRLMLMAAMLQLFAAYGNVFERLADYYFFFVILCLPEIALPTQMKNGNAWWLGAKAKFAIGVTMTICLIGYFFVFVLDTPGFTTYSTWLATLVGV